PVPRARRRAPRLRPAGAERLGAGLRAARPQVAALDRPPKLGADVRPFRTQRHVPLGRPGCGRRPRVPDRSDLRPVGGRSVAGPFRRSPRRALTLRALRVAGTGLSLSLLLAACGPANAPPGNAPVLLHVGELPGWRAVDDTPGIADLAPNLSGLKVR